MNTGQFQRTNSLAGSTRRLPLAIWALGFGSLLMDTSSELVHSLSPVLLVNILGASVVAVGMVEGVAEFSLVEKEFGRSLKLSVEGRPQNTLKWCERRVPVKALSYSVISNSFNRFLFSR
jgi:hypothetical protein